MAYHSKIRAQVQANLTRAGFPLARRNRVENILVQAICHFRLFRNRSRMDPSPIPGRTHLRAQPKRRGPKDKKEMRMYLLSQLHYAGVLGFQEYLNINNKNYPSTPFVAFAESVLLFEGIFRIAGNLEEFRAYRKKTFEKYPYHLIWAQDPERYEIYIAGLRARQVVEGMDLDKTLRYSTAFQNQHLKACQALDVLDRLEGKRAYAVQPVGAPQLSPISSALEEGGKIGLLQNEMTG